MISRFFFPEELPAAGEVALPEALAHHAVRVLRLRDGEPLVLFDGRGGETSARLSVRGRQCFAVLGERSAVERESPLDLVLAQGLAGGDKMDWIVQKATELGVAGVVPLAAERSVIRLAGERAAKRVAHWRQVVVAACEQSGRNRVPEVAGIQPLEAWLAGAHDVRKLVLAPGGGRRTRELAPPAAGERVVLMVGPEGGWTDAELAACLRAGAEAMSLGPRVLRTETAGLAALAALQALWGDA
ncbi:16S rRNA (uracil(1498)-N(3))-methyltransferase [Pseudothauera nasutitermitis]|uniref:Ribosomal RNA small subunit methyltransferase E n=1 Tax=Pseudothauera nasutitermitis TaxID=2565930 RepID=A0A4S4ARG5_9RHOO|nr:16S rRNA (uracil(1498)-N(3))-methyltransferase [Pseudothauera nasutitermitis]THF62365.1 16S rRNA (uracil(1498)-N(3))-methyltransferase [Pseudothauera nasutitermitis]